MKTIKNPLYVFALVCSLLISCGDDDDPVLPEKNNAKAITSFKFSEFTPEVVGTISEADKKILLIVPFGTNVTALVPTITVSDKASVTPHSGISNDFTEPTTYVVKAEDGSEQSYLVTVTVAEDEAVVIDKLPETSVKLEETFAIHGSNFGDPSSITIVFKKVGGDEEVEIEATEESNSNTLYFEIPTDIQVGEYNIILRIGDDSFELDEVVTISTPSPEITGIDKTTVTSGESVTITGKYFAESGNKVWFVAEGFMFGAEIESESATSITVTVPVTFTKGEHTLLIEVGESEVEYSGVITIGDPSSDPVVTGINKTTFNVGETIVVVGQNLKSPDVYTFFYFWPSEGTAFQRIVQVNEAGTHASYTIPGDFTPGQYEIEIYVDFNVIESFIININ